MSHIGTLKKALEPYPRMKPSEWCEANIILPPSVTNRPGPLKLAPWFVQIIDELENAETETVNVYSAAQVGKSLLELCIMAYTLVVFDSPGLSVYPTEADSVALLRRRFLPITNASPALKEVIKFDREHKNSHEIFGQNSSFKAGWSNSAGSLASIACKVVLLDECAKYNDSVQGEADAYSLATARVATYRRQGSKIYGVTTPVVDEGPFHHHYMKGIQHEWHFHCPHCDKLSLPAWERFKWEKVESLANMRSDDVRYICEHCEKPIKERQYFKAVRKGEWVCVDEDAADKSKANKSYHLSGLLSDAYSWDYLVKEWLKSQQSPQAMQHIINSIWGNVWLEKRITIAESAISKLIIDLPALEVPPETMKIVAGLDVGGQPGLEPDADGKGMHFWVTLLAVHPAGKYTCIYTGRFLGWTETYKFLTQEFRCPSSNSNYFVAQAYVDSGYETADIYGLSVKNPGVFACKGLQYGTEPVKNHLIDAIQGAFGKKKYIGANISVANIDTTYFKDRLWSLIANELIHFATGIHQDTPKHIAAEVKRPVNKKGGRFAYCPKYKGIESHTLDSTVYALACSFALGDYRFNSWEEWLAISPPPEPIQAPQAPQAPPAQIPSYQSNWNSGLSPY